MSSWPPGVLERLERVFVTGTDTGVGKTHVTSLLARAQRARGLDTIALKPVCCGGGREDAEILRSACGNELALEIVNPVWFPEPLAPAVAGRNCPPSLEALESWFFETVKKRKSVLVEGAGGWLVPLAPGRTMADLAVRFGLPVVIVVANRLGCLNHALLTLASVREHRLPFLGFIFNSCCPAAGAPDQSLATNRQALEEASGYPVLHELTWQPSI